MLDSEATLIFYLSPLQTFKTWVNTSSQRYLTCDGELGGGLSVLALTGVLARVALLCAEDDQLGVGPLLPHLVLVPRSEHRPALRPVHGGPGPGQLTAEHGPAPLPHRHRLHLLGEGDREG